MNLYVYGGGVCIQGFMSYLLNFKNLKLVPMHL